MLLTAQPSQVTQAVGAMHPSSFGCDSLGGVHQTAIPKNDSAASN
jgi:hypothetical protein